MALTSMETKFCKLPLDFEALLSEDVENSRLASCSEIESIDQFIELLISTAPGEHAFDKEFGCEIFFLDFESIVSHTRKPLLVPGNCLGYIWQTLLNGLLSMWGQPLLKLSATNGFIGMVILLLWQQIGYMMIIYVAGLNNVSPDLIEAAQIDGATESQILFKIKIPMIMPSVTICTFLTLTNANTTVSQNA